MSAAFTKHGLAAVQPTHLSHAGAFAGGERRRSGGVFTTAVARAFQSLRGGRNGVLNELNALSERELADIGLSRGDIHRVFDPAFAAEHAARR